MTSNEQKKQNQRLGLILASVALVFFLGFVGKIVLRPGSLLPQTAEIAGKQAFGVRWCSPLHPAG